ncbi:MAG TPA: DUF6351 family protein, partial [Mycobacteriales bacterium]|nr:DUF6351 family protein [Mycobacteriales bacterium]
MAWRWTVVVAMVLGVPAVIPAQASAAAPTIKVLSSRADLVSAGQALVELSTPTTKGLHVAVGGRDVTKAFALRTTGRVQGLVEGLRVGPNALTARVNDGRVGRLTITNHPNGGPVFTGPQVQPWRCPAGSRDKQCNRPPQYTYLYRSIDPSKAGLQSYNREAPPADVATTTTDQGVTVPFVVRLELGYQARDQYKVLTLFDPTKRWTRWTPQRAWNHKVLVTGGGGCGGGYGSSSAPLEDFSGTFGETQGRPDSYIDALGRGFAVMSTALANTGHNCNVATEAEALMMLKEHVIEQ